MLTGKGLAALFTWYFLKDTVSSSCWLCAVTSFWPAILLIEFFFICLFVSFCRFQVFSAGASCLQINSNARMDIFYQLWCVSLVAQLWVLLLFNLSLLFFSGHHSIYFRWHYLYSDWSCFIVRFKKSIYYTDLVLMNLKNSLI